jgi:2-keto-3-deoxy-L-rhamnonate aldolase RhmA
MDLSAALKRKVKSGQPVFGTWFNIPHPMVGEILASSGFDFILMDGEHSPIHPDLISGLLTATELRGTPVVYRVRSNREDLIKAALDAGVSGISVPLVHSSNDAARAVAAAKYPPLGRRGIGPWRASNYYRDYAGYVAQANDGTILVLQIESKEALSEIEQIAALPDYDVLFLGPDDLAGSMGLEIGKLHPELLAAYRKVAAAARKFGKTMGIDLATVEYLEQYMEVGFRFFTHGADTGYLIDGAQRAVTVARKRAVEIERNPKASKRTRGAGHRQQFRVE